jgi:hypothetical protein
MMNIDKNKILVIEVYDRERNDIIVFHCVFDSKTETIIDYKGIVKSSG